MTPTEQCIIHGGTRLEGRVQIYGAKNSALPVIVAALMTSSPNNGSIHELQNVPDISDVRSLLRLLSAMGCHPPSLLSHNSDEFDMIARKIRGSVLLLGPMLARFGAVRLPLPGGCSIGDRPVDLFLKSLNALGANLSIDYETECIVGSCKQLVGTTFRFETYLGGRIEGEGTSTITIKEALTPLRSGKETFAIRGDRIEAGTYLFAAAATGGDVVVDGVIPSDLGEVLKVLEAMGCEMSVAKIPYVYVVLLPGPQDPRIDLSWPHRAYFTDPEARRIHQYIKIDKDLEPSRYLSEKGDATTIEIEGPSLLRGKTVGSTDLRCAASLVVAGLVAKGETMVQDLHFLDRGYANIVEKFRLLGADIRRATILPSGMRVLCDEPLSDRTTLRVGGNAKFFLSVNDRSELATGLAWAQEQDLNIFVLGGGSNVVVDDAGFNGLVIEMTDSSLKVLEESDNDVLIEVGAGHNWDQFVSAAVNMGLSGVEYLSGIPGTVGASPIQNIGAYGQEVAQIIEGVNVMDRKDRTIKTLTKEECMFAYRSSNFKTIWLHRYVIVSVECRLERQQSIDDFGQGEYSRKQVLRRLRDKGEGFSLTTIRNAALEIRGEKSMILCEDDPNSRSVGSFFMNPILLETVYLKVCESLSNLGIDGTNMPAKIVHQTNDTSCSNGVDEPHVQISAAWLIEKAGFYRGYEDEQFPGVALSSRHCLALITKESAGASATSLVGFADFIRARVEKLFGVFLKMEPTVLRSDITVVSGEDSCSLREGGNIGGKVESGESDLDDTKSTSLSKSSSISSISLSGAGGEVSSSHYLVFGVKNELS
ncbi:UDP-N-acetylglucosamine 1-carboxyvinyltransferase/UDP-N-acetylenolpyruvoylglucosamine reductase [Skeletonema marinoi]|uniref:UDP-N-acetylmuramate dehydrogenase n=1 Tax=Skeletonema marinoi TaxID=267567 RepID=A0AAD8XVG1_9STRA|nr:UDP-N-acetylglucosamine 1-carboxyvinyltransferase/UDP-N-acetylenolpyruvoylglucosamine reductase [Skeletonema marinoi]